MDEGRMQKEAGQGHTIESIEGTSFRLWHSKHETGLFPSFERVGMIHLLDHVPV